MTFDSDFVDLSIVKGFPPKIIWLKTGNQTTGSIAEILNMNVLSVAHFIQSNEVAVLEIVK